MNSRDENCEQTGKRPSGGHMCAAVGCGNTTARNPELRFHAFPKNEQTKKKWIEAVRRMDYGMPWTPHARSMLCSAHFTPDSYHQNLRIVQDVGLSTKFARLNFDAVPTIFPEQPSLPEEWAPFAKRRRLVCVSCLPF